MGIVSEVLAARSKNESAAEQKSLDTRADVIAVILADTQGEAPRASAKLINAAIDAGVISADECLQLQVAAEELKELLWLQQQRADRQNARDAAERELANAREQWKQTQERLCRQASETRDAAMQSINASQRLVILKQEIPELFDSEEGETIKPNYFESVEPSTVEPAKKAINPSYQFES